MCFFNQIKQVMSFGEHGEASLVLHLVCFTDFTLSSFIIIKKSTCMWYMAWGFFQSWPTNQWDKHVTAAGALMRTQPEGTTQVIPQGEFQAAVPANGGVERWGWADGLTESPSNHQVQHLPIGVAKVVMIWASNPIKFLETSQRLQLLRFCFVHTSDTIRWLGNYT